MTKQRWVMYQRTRSFEVHSHDDYGSLTVKARLRVTFCKRTDAYAPPRQVYEVCYNGAWQTVNPMRVPELRYQFEQIERELPMTSRAAIYHRDTDGQRPRVPPVRAFAHRGVH